MYDYLEGSVAHRAPGRLVLDVGGVGYELCVPLTAHFAEGARIRAWAHLIVREDSHTLYGFPDRGTREFFRLLLRVRGVGPVMALSVLSGLDRRALVQAIIQEDLRALTRIRGIGRKTAEQILLDLREKAAELARSADEGLELADIELVPEPRKGHKNITDATAALVSLGYSEKEARKQVEAAVEKVGPLALEDLVRVALQS